MKRVFIFLLCGAALATTSAQTLRPLDKDKRADDVNNKMVNPPTVETQTLTPGTAPVTRSPASDKSRSFGRVETSSVATPSVDRPTLQPAVLPHVNFVAKRAVESDKILDEKRVESNKAPIKGAVIQALTPAGEEQLKKTLNPARLQ